jgi:hypothetical protein
MSRWRWFSVHGFLPAAMVGVALLLVGGLLFYPAVGGISAPLGAAPKQFDLPQYGWEVCADLGYGDVPGVDGQSQRIALCHGDGWVVYAHCIEPLKEAPELYTVCSVENGVFWCGDDVQLLQEYQLQQTAAPSSTPRPSATPLPSATPQPSATATVQATAVPSITSTPEEVPPVGGEGTPTMQATVYYRPHAGGTGTVGPFLSALAAAVGLGLLAAALLLNRRG